MKLLSSPTHLGGGLVEAPTGPGMTLLGNQNIKTYTFTKFRFNSFVGCYSKVHND